MVWPKFRMRRRPPSRSSFDTTSALICADSTMAGVSASGSCAKMAFVVVRQVIEQRPAPDHSVLDHFVQPGAELPARQRAQHARIGQDERGLVKRADQVLAQRVVDAHLAADGAVHLRQQRRGHLHQRDAAQEAGGGEPRGVADDAAANGHERAAAVGAAADQRVVDPRHRRQRLVALAVGDEDRVAGNRPLDRRAVVTPDPRARHHEPLRPDAVRVQARTEVVHEPVAHPDGRRLRPGDHVDAGCECAPAVIVCGCAAR